MKHFIFHILALLLACSSVLAKKEAKPAPAPASALDELMETGMEVSGVRAPYYDEQGNLKAQLYGGHAKVLEGGVAEVTNLRIEVYQDGAVTMTVFAPKCITQVVEEDGRNTLVVHSDGDVLIDMEQMSIYGKGFRFSSENNRFEILSDSKVIVKETAKSIEGMGL
ncbi:LptA/OstA family protein [Pontiella sulfatireligans]|uniref:LPS-assembly protein LptD n=1 Tax=Pontiella sulfatireligans TaxID=2750658 RepID=A0A6C2UX38_9BACT|nr:hypothetical protein [Pontiella sulfatireligans]VGO23416.1 hypothetical protein SCARR_05523 [Pontiella sulfatireligans]